MNKLTHKAELLEAELDSTNNQLREAKITADVENLKCKAAKEVISSLTTQVVFCFLVLWIIGVRGIIFPTFIWGTIVRS